LKLADHAVHGHRRRLANDADSHAAVAEMNGSATQQKGITVTRRLAWVLLALHLLVLLVGTQMSGAWRDGIERSLHAPSFFSSLAHFVLFAGMGGLSAMRPLSWPVGRVVLVTSGLALLTEALQFLAVDRHPRWLDVGIDMAGVLTGVGLINVLSLCRIRR
jgi:VanZ like family